MQQSFALPHAIKGLDAKRAAPQNLQGQPLAFVYFRLFVFGALPQILTQYFSLGVSALEPRIRWHTAFAEGDKRKKDG
jgi:hypothetical protein